MLLSAVLATYIYKQFLPSSSHMEGVFAHFDNIVNHKILHDKPF